MREVAQIVFLLLVLLGTQLALHALSFDKLLGTGALCVFLGLARGLPAALVYHLQLARKLGGFYDSQSVGAPCRSM